MSNMDGVKFDFKRDAYQKLCSMTESILVTVLLGPRKCGKTYLMKQYEQEHENSSYYSVIELGKDNTLS